MATQTSDSIDNITIEPWKQKLIEPLDLFYNIITC